ncbi:MAG: ABC transporter ATP-binding protein [Bacteroidales bacterium]|nr:ABC transporter ATP-binding protein [Bacteroidales bacterium]
MKVLEINNLSLSFNTNQGSNCVLKDVSFFLEQGKTLGIVGESGSGKSITALSILKLLPKNAILNSGEILFNDGDTKVDLLTQEEKKLLEIRGNRISMIFQEPMTSLNPSIKCGKQVEEIILLHSKIDRRKAQSKVVDLFKEVQLPSPKRIYNSYPHEISGGQKQRVMIAMAIAIKPAVLIADEPTTALDVTVQKTIINLLKDIQKKYGISILFISHDLGVISQIADDIVVMYKGEVVESGEKNKVLLNPDHQYTKGLLSCRPSVGCGENRLSTLSDYIEGKNPDKVHANTFKKSTYNDEDIILNIRSLSKDYVVKKNFLGRIIKSHLAVSKISFQVYKGETLGLVGESGCGKTTLGRMIVQLIQASSGSVEYKGERLNLFSKSNLRDFRKKVQIIFQDPYSSLNPKKTVGDLIGEPLYVHNIGKNSTERRQRVFEILEKVRLESSSFYKYPHEFSGGQRQRIVIARALILNPEFIICDESVSALDVSIQAEILNLLNDLKEEFGLTYIFISHDLSVVKYMSDRILVMKDGELVEINKADEIYNSPASDYTKKLIESIPEITIN